MKKWITILQSVAVIILIISLAVSFDWLRLIATALMAAALVLTIAGGKHSE